MKFTDKHYKILKDLRKNARKSFSEMSRDLEIPVSTVFQKYKELNKNCVIKHCAIPNYAKIGYPIRRIFVIKNKSKDKELEFLQSLNCVNNIWRSNQNKTLVDAHFQNFDELEQFSKTLANKKIKQERIIDILQELKYEDFLGEA